MKRTKRIVAILCALLICVQMFTMVASASSAPYLEKGYRYNSKRAVTVLQTMLNKVMKSGLTVDGDFGSATEKAVKNFQKKYGLTVDGKVGPETWTALFKCCTIKSSNTGGKAMVLLLQKMLNKVLKGKITPLDEDGIWGSKTTAAVKKFQSTYGLDVDGIVGQATWNELVGRYK